MGGIEFYPQKEFDEDMEDKSDNDKIRVSSFLFFQLHRIVPSFFRNHHNPVFLWILWHDLCMFHI